MSVGRSTAVSVLSGTRRADAERHHQAAYDHENTSDTAVEALVRVGDACFGGAVLFSIPLLVATGLAILRHGGLPRRLAGSASLSRWRWPSRACSFSASSWGSAAPAA
jgi:hypothetical protein